MARKRLFDDNGNALSTRELSSNNDVQEEVVTLGRKSFFSDAGDFVSPELQNVQEQKQEEQKLMDSPLLFSREATLSASKGNEITEEEMGKIKAAEQDAKPVNYFLKGYFQVFDTIKGSAEFLGQKVGLIKQQAPEEIQKEKEKRALNTFEEGLSRQSRMVENLSEQGVTKRMTTDPYSLVSQDEKDRFKNQNIISRTGEALGESVTISAINLAGGLAGGALEILGVKLNNKFLRDQGEKISDSSRAFLYKHPELLPSQEMKGLFEGGAFDPEWYGRTIGGTLPYMGMTVGASLGASAILRSGIAPTIAAFTTTAGMEGGVYYNSLIDQGLAPSQVADAAIVYGAVSAYIELGMGYNPAKIAMGEESNNIIKQTVKDNYMKFMAKYLPTVNPAFLGKVAKVLSSNPMQEGYEEVLQQFAQNSASAYLGQNQNLMQDLAENFAGGVVGSLPFGGASYVSGKLHQMGKVNIESKPLTEKELPKGTAIEMQKEIDTEATRVAQVEQDKKTFSLLEEKALELGFPSVKTQENPIIDRINNQEAPTGVFPGGELRVHMKTLNEDINFVKSGEAMEVTIGGVKEVIRRTKDMTDEDIIDRYFNVLLRYEKQVKDKMTPEEEARILAGEKGVGKVIDERVVGENLKNEGENPVSKTGLDVGQQGKVDDLIAAGYEMEDLGIEKKPDGSISTTKLDRLYGKFAQNKAKESEIPEITTARDAAKHLIRHYVERGDSIEELKAGQMVSYGGQYNAGIGGSFKGKSIGTGKIKVEKLNGKELKPAQIFSLKELYNEIKAEFEAKKAKKPDLKKGQFVKITNKKGVVRTERVEVLRVREDGIMANSPEAENFPMLWKYDKFNFEAFEKNNPEAAEKKDPISEQKIVVPEFITKKKVSWRKWLGKTPYTLIDSWGNGFFQIKTPIPENVQKIIDKSDTTNKIDKKLEDVLPMDKNKKPAHFEARVVMKGGEYAETDIVALSDGKITTHVNSEYLAAAIKSGGDFDGIYTSQNIKEGGDKFNGGVYLTKGNKMVAVVMEIVIHDRKSLKTIEIFAKKDNAKIDKGRPEYNKQYSLTKISEGKTWPEAEQAFLERKYNRIKTLKEDLIDTKQSMLGYQGETDAWQKVQFERYSKKEKDIISNIKKEKERMKGLNIEEIKAQEMEKAKEIKKQEALIEGLSKVFEEKMKEAETIRIETIVTPNDFSKYTKEVSTENKDFFIKAGSSGSRGASVGMFSDGTPIKTGSLETILPVQFPELIEFVRNLGSSVIINKRLKAATRGKFQAGGIQLNKRIFNNTEQASKTLAHEIGHLVDWLPDMALDRGNILGRIYTLRNFLKGSYGKDSIKNNEYREELWELSKYWRPMPGEYTETYQKYRKSSAELYADALSALLNSPGILQEKAPNFYKSFFEALDRKPEVLKAYFSLQDQLRLGSTALVGSRRGRFRGMLNRADFNAIEIQQIKESEIKKENYIGQLWSAMKRELFTLHEVFEKKTREVLKRGGIINDNENPEYYLNERNYVGSKIKAVIEKNLFPVLLELKKHGLTLKDLGEILFYERILKGDRGEVANPGGFQKEFVEEMMGESAEVPSEREAKANEKSLKGELGEEKFAILAEQAQKFRSGLKNVFEMGYREGLYGDSLYELMNKNDFYVPFKTQKYMDQKTKFTVKGKTGTLSDIENPVNTSIEKAMAIVRAIENNKAKRAGILFLQKEFSGDIQKAETRYVNDHLETVETKDDKKGTVFYMKNGKPQGFYVGKYIANSLNNRTTEEIKIITATLGTMNKKWFKPVFVGFNTGFQLANFSRDFFRFWRNIPKMSFLKAMKLYAKALPYAVQKARNKQNDLIGAMEEEGILGLSMNDYLSGGTEEDIQNDIIMQKIGLADGKQSLLAKSKILRPVKILLNIIKEMGDTIEAMPKVAAYIHFNGNEAGAKISMKEKDFIRRFVGSPDFFAKGSWTVNSNNIFLFSNAIIQGIRSDTELALGKETRAEFWWKTAKTVLIPKMLMTAAALGMFGELLKEIMDEATEYDKANYIIIPLGKDQNKKAVYFRLPQDESSRFIGAMAWKSNRFLTTGDISSIEDIIGLWGGQIPKVTPALSLPADIFQFAQGKNVYDTFRQRTVLTDDQAAAGWKYKAAPIATYIFNQAGGNIFMKLYSGEPTNLTGSEKILQLPIVSNIVGRFFKITDYGKSEIIDRDITAPLEKEAAEKRIESKILINEYVGKVNRTENLAERAVLERELAFEIMGRSPKGSDDRAEVKRIIKKLDIAVIKGSSDETINSLIYATSNEEKRALLLQYKKTMSPEEFTKLRNLVIKHKIVSREAFSSLNK